MTIKIFPVIAICIVATASLVSGNRGTCASIGYSNRCCPPGGNCQASDGICRCSADCHQFGDCCSDVSCPQNPRTCQDIGIQQCCNEDTAGTGNCIVYYRHGTTTNRCSCAMSCHQNNNIECCPDAVEIGCVPQTCAQAGKGAGCCSLSSSSSCYVSGGDCYCDISCVAFDDCCEDVPVPQCPAANGNARRSRVQPNLAQGNSMPSYAHPFQARYLEPYSQSQNVYVDRYAPQREALATRAQRIRAAKEYRARARNTVRRPSA